MIEGPDDAGRILVVIATLRGGNIRPITAYPRHRRDQRPRKPKP